jgi:hypothetical protein
MISKLAELSALNRALFGRIQIELAAQAPKKRTRKKATI